MVAKAGTIISEQTVPTGYNTYTPTDDSTPSPQKSEEQKIADDIVLASQGAGTNEKNFLASVNKIKSATQFWNVNSYLKTVGNKLDFAGIVNDEMGYEDGPDVQTIVNKLKSIGVNVTADIDKLNQFRPDTFKLGSAPASTPATGTRTPEAMKNITNTFCGVRNGKITSGAFKDQPWSTYKSTYSVTDNEEKEAKKSCPTGQRVVQSGPSVSTRFTDSAKSLGIEGGKMDLQTLQTILKSLEGETTTAAATTTQGAPDLAQLTAALNQLNA